MVSVAAGLAGLVALSPVGQRGAGGCAAAEAGGGATAACVAGGGATAARVDGGGATAARVDGAGAGGACVTAAGASVAGARDAAGTACVFAGSALCVTVAACVACLTGVPVAVAVAGVVSPVGVRLPCICCFSPPQ